MKYGFLLVFLLAFSSLKAQDSNSFTYTGDLRFSVFGNSNDADNFESENTTGALRMRIGGTYNLNSTHSFTGRIAGMINDNLEQLRFKITADRGGVYPNTFTFDQFYYEFNNEKTRIRLGRFQNRLDILSNAKRSHIRFQNNNVNIHWSDGIYWKQKISSEWYSEFIGEYQPDTKLTYPYRGSLDFGNNDHNLTTYLGAENRTRDQYNIIQKALGLFYAPNAYNKNNNYTSYIAFSSRIAFDFPSRELLNGGSFRITGEYGQNLNTAFEDGTIAVFTAGINGFADRHEIMVDLTKTDSQWLLANIYVPNADELELRYRFFADENLNFDIRYRIRDFRTSGIGNQYGYFVRATYSF